MLATVRLYGVPAAATLSREGRVRRLFLEDNLVVFAASNEREAGLESHLLARGAIDAETARQAEARRARDGLRLGQVLLQMGALTPERLNQEVRAQVREILRGALCWESGDILLEIGVRRAGEFVRIDLPIEQAILDGVRCAGDVRRLAQRLGTAQAVYAKAPSPALSLFSADERAFYENVDGKTPLGPLCANGPGGPGEAARLLYAFFCLGLVRRMPPAAAKKIQYRTKEL